MDVDRKMKIYKINFLGIALAFFLSSTLSSKSFAFFVKVRLGTGKNTTTVYLAEVISSKLESSHLIENAKYGCLNDRGGLGIHIPSINDKDMRAAFVNFADIFDRDVMFTQIFRRATCGDNLKAQCDQLFGERDHSGFVIFSDGNENLAGFRQADNV